MRKTCLDALSRVLLDRARIAGGGRTADTVIGGHECNLRQTLIAIARGSTLDDHASPGEATLFVVRGRVRVTAGQDSWEVREGDLLDVTELRHDLQAVDDSTVLLTVLKERHLASDGYEERRAAVARSHTSIGREAR